MNKIELVHVGEDYITISYVDIYGDKQEAEITGMNAMMAIITLGQALKKKSFMKADISESFNN